MNVRKKLVQTARDSKRKWRERSKILTAFARRCSAQKMRGRKNLLKLALHNMGLELEASQEILRRRAEKDC